MKWGLGAFVVIVYLIVWCLCRAASKGEKEYE